VEGGVTMATPAVELGTGSSNLWHQIQQETGEDVNACFQCGKCSAGCPVSYAMDYVPAQLMHAIRLGLDDLVIDSKTMWLCASCQACTTRCPQDLDIALVLDTVKIISMRRKRKSPVKGIADFYKYALQSIRMFGRMYEVGLLANLGLRNREMMADMELGKEMFKKRKLKLFPDISLSRSLTANQIFSRAMKREKRLGK
jgi:heterodisulfide reductase subunit C